MVLMTGRVAFWPFIGGYTHRGMSIEFDDVMTEWALTLSSDRKVCIHLNRERQIRLTACDTGVQVSPCRSADQSKEFSHRACTSKLVDPTRALKADIELPLFSVFTLGFKEDGKDLVAQLPVDHELPWPSRKTLSACPDAAATCKEALEIRMQSLVASGIPGFGNNPPPGHIRAHLSPAIFAEARRTALALNGDNR